jgi:hypothetical protein
MNNELLGIAYRILAPYLGLDGALEEGGPETTDIDSDISAKDEAFALIKRKLGSVGVLLGTRETGKSTLAYRYAMFLERPTFAVSPEQKPPSWITRTTLDDIDSVPKHSTVIMDDLPAYASNRDYNDGLVRALERIIPMCRHEREWHLIFCSQTAAQADKYILDCDIAFLKPLGLLSADIERPAITKIYKTLVNQHFESRDDAWVKRHAYCITPSWKGVIEISKVD